MVLGLFCSLINEVETNETSLMHPDKGTERESVMDVADKIYSMLSDD
jgi:hypothetical protein